MPEMLTTQEQSTESKFSTITSCKDFNQHQNDNIEKVPWYAVILCRSGIHWGKWEYLKENECSQQKVCQRCSKIRTRTKHQWEWRYIKSGSCEQEKVCKRCSCVTRQRIRHDWGPTYSDIWGRYAHNCDRCGEVETWTNSG